ncbi:hypothetical protein JXM67_11920 [candidate division WOR-3 bacterium]|nr:hypothetical protein [candidate division WOR-3 bacterium]
MKLVYPTSLAKTLDTVNDAYFTSERLTKGEKLEVARFIVSRHGLPRSYAGMFAPTDADFEEGIKVFTGELITSGAGTSHILGEESLRALNLLNVQDKDVQKALDEATCGIQARLDVSSYKSGTYCCGICTASLWRHALVGKLRNRDELFEKGLKTLKTQRLGDGKWRRFPFYYTLLAISEVDHPLALGEVKYAAPVLEKALRRKASGDKYGIRRRTLAERILEKI